MLTVDAVIKFCERPRRVKEVAQHFGVPFGSMRQLMGTLVDRGMLFTKLYDGNIKYFTSRSFPTYRWEITDPGCMDRFIEERRNFEWFTTRMSESRIASALYQEGRMERKYVNGVTYWRVKC